MRGTLVCQRASTLECLYNKSPCKLEHRDMLGTVLKGSCQPDSSTFSWRFPPPKPKYKEKLFFSFLLHILVSVHRSSSSQRTGHSVLPEHISPPLSPFCIFQTWPILLIPEHIQSLSVPSMCLFSVTLSQRLGRAYSLL